MDRPGLVLYRSRPDDFQPGRSCRPAVLAGQQGAAVAMQQVADERRCDRDRGPPECSLKRLELGPCGCCIPGFLPGSVSPLP